MKIVRKERANIETEERNGILFFWGRRIISSKSFLSKLRASKREKSMEKAFREGHNNVELQEGKREWKFDSLGKKR